MTVEHKHRQRARAETCHKSELHSDRALRLARSKGAGSVLERPVPTEHTFTPSTDALQGSGIHLHEGKDPCTARARSCGLQHKLVEHAAQRSFQDCRKAVMHMWAT